MRDAAIDIEEGAFPHTPARQTLITLQTVVVSHVHVDGEGTPGRRYSRCDQKFFFFFFEQRFKASSKIYDCFVIK